MFCFVIARVKPRTVTRFSYIGKNKIELKIDDKYEKFRYRSKRSCRNDSY